MTKGKISAQCCHAAVAVVEPLIQHKDPVYLAWQSDGATKIAVRIDSGEQGLLDVFRAARRNKQLSCEYIRDAGRTQIAAGSATVCAVFGPVEQVDTVTGTLKLL
ncbi:MAG: hypothetical protein SGCHY_000073 [Lobulomycetales sp.]